MNLLANLVNMGLAGWIPLSLLLVILAVIVTVNLVARPLRGILSVSYGLLIGLSLPPLAYLLAYVLASQSETIPPEVYPNLLFWFLLLWILALVLLALWLWRLYQSPPKDWIYEGIVFSSYRDYLSWRRTFLWLLVVPGILLALPAWRLINWPLALFEPFAGVENLPPLLLQGIQLVVLLALLSLILLLWSLMETLVKR